MAQKGRISRIATDVINVGVAFPGRREVFEVSLSETIKDLKEKVHERIGVPVEEQELVFNQKVLLNNKKIDYYKIQNDRTIAILGDLSKYALMDPGFQKSNESKSEEGSLSDIARKIQETYNQNAKLLEQQTVFFEYVKDLQKAKTTAPTASTTSPTTAAPAATSAPAATPAPAKPIFAGMNRPYAGARTVKALPVGNKPIQLYSLSTPNGIKVNLALEEMGLEYDAHTINIIQLDQFTTGFTEISPNGKIPALVDKQGPDGKPIRVFESGSILLYLATKTGKFIPPAGTAEYVECMNWLFFQHGSLGPFFGQFGHFFKYAPEKIQYAIDRYSMEVKRLLDVVDKQLEGKKYILGDQYTIADMAIYPWVKCLDTGYNGKQFLYQEAFGMKNSYSNVEAWVARIGERPATAKANTVTHFTQPSAMGEDKGTPLPEPKFT